MVNQVQESIIPLGGRGLVHRPHGKFQVGEYEVLDNLETTPEGTLRGRRGFNWFSQNSLDPATFYTNSRKFIGHFGPYPLIADQNGSIYLGYNYNNLNTDILYKQTNISLVGITSDIQNAGESLPVGYSIGTANSQFEGYWHYNGNSYFLIEYHDVADNGGGSSTRIYRRRLAVRQVQKEYNLHADNPALLLDDVKELSIAPAEVTVLVEDSKLTGHAFSVPSSPRFYIKNHLIHKDRAWIATEDTIYYSDAGNHAVWAAPDGGFIKFPNEEIKQIYAYADVIYVVCDAKIYTVTYDVDFNTDGQVICISPELGGDAICSIGDTIFTLKYGSLYSINGSNVTKIMDINLNIPFGANDLSGSYSHITKMAAFDGELYIFMSQVTGILNESDGYYYNTKYSRLIYLTDPIVYPDNDTDTQLFKISTSTGSVSRVNLSPSLKAAWSSTQECIIAPLDILLVPVENNANQNFLHFLNYTQVGSSAGFTVSYPGLESLRFSGFVSQKNWGVDVVIGSGFDNFQGVTPFTRFRLKDISPDGSKFNIKRLRSLLLDANFPYLSFTPPGGANLKLYLNELYSESDLFSNFDILRNRGNGSSPYRFGINQRVRYFTLDFNRASRFATGGEENLFELNDLRFLWTPTSRSITKNDALVDNT